MNIEEAKKKIKNCDTGWYCQEAFDKLLKEIERLQSKNKKVQTILRTRARQDRKRKAKLRKLRLETTNQRLKLELLHSIIKEVREYMESIEHEPDADMYIELGQYKEYKYILEILEKENKE